MQKPVLSRERQKFATNVGVLIVVQGLTWFSLSLAGIIVINAPPEKLTATSFTKYSDYLSRIIYQNFMREGVSEPNHKVIRPIDFEVFLWIYAILSAIWVAAAIDLNYAIRGRKPRQSYNTIAVGVIVLLTSIIDLVFFALLARDFTTCPFDLEWTPIEVTSTSIATTQSSSLSTTVTDIPESTAVPEEFYAQLYADTEVNVATAIDCQVASGIVMSLAARGYVLWLLNVVLAVLLLKTGANALRNPKFLTYSRNTIPRVKMHDHGSHNRKPPSPINDLFFHGDNDRYSPSALGTKDRSRNGTPVALNSKNPSIYF